MNMSHLIARLAPTSDPPCAALREALKQEVAPEALHVPHLTPEGSIAYAVAWQLMASW